MICIAVPVQLNYHTCMTIKAYKKTDGRVVLEINDTSRNLFIPETCELDFQHLTWKNKEEHQAESLVEAE